MIKSLEISHGIKLPIVTKATWFKFRTTHFDTTRFIINYLTQLEREKGRGREREMVSDLVTCSCFKPLSNGEQKHNGTSFPIIL
jgi:hypothetical protein